MSSTGSTTSDDSSTTVLKSMPKMAAEAVIHNNNNKSKSGIEENKKDDENDADSVLEIPGTRVGSSGRQLAIIFTCTVCETRSMKQFTQRAYEHGVVLVRCPGCQNLHLIADRLGYFKDNDEGGASKSRDIESLVASVKRVTEANVSEVTLEDIMGKEKYQELLKRHEAASSLTSTDNPQGPK